MNSKTRHFAIPKQLDVELSSNSDMKRNERRDVDCHKLARHIHLRMK